MIERQRTNLNLETLAFFLTEHYSLKLNPVLIGIPHTLNYHFPLEFFKSTLKTYFLCDQCTVVLSFIFMRLLHFLMFVSLD